MGRYHPKRGIYWGYEVIASPRLNGSVMHRFSPLTHARVDAGMRRACSSQHGKAAAGESSGVRVSIMKTILHHAEVAT